MPIPLAYNLRNLAARKVSTILTSLGIGLVSWVFIFTLALAGGFQSALQATGSRSNAIVIRNGSTAELTSIIARDAAATIESQPEIARAQDGTPLATHELVVLWNLERKNGTAANVVVRGVTAKSLALRPKVHLVEGRMFRPGLEEVVVGKLANAR
ncbi:MAG TPA: ABC transporter permease, partial [Methylomirabilota bacterium]|nr:ABC transporter permease [Methylomirabilota bacterium]